MYKQITQIANNIAALAGPFKALEEMVALHTKQIAQLMDDEPSPPPPPPPGDALFDACFNQGGEDGNLYGFYWHQNRPVIVASGHGPASREGQRMAYCYLHRHNSQYAYRTMGLYCKRDDMAPDTRERWTFDFNEDYWIAISMFLPDDWVPDNLGTILWQCQRTPDPQELYRQPCLYVAAKAGRWVIGTRWDERAFSPPGEGSHWPGSKNLYRADLDLGKWTDWLFHVRWHWEGGLVQAWKNGKQIADYSGGNCANDARGPNASFGVYEWSWRKEHWSKYTYKAVERNVWFDSIRIGRKRTDVAIPT